MRAQGAKLPTLMNQRNRALVLTAQPRIFTCIVRLLDEALLAHLLRPFYNAKMVL